MKIYCMSDIHGCLWELEEALSYVLEHLREDDTKLLFLGDYIHYGNENYEVLDRIMGLQEKYGDDKVIALMGNHEDMVLEGYNTINDDGNDNEDDDKYINWMRGQILRRL